MTNSESRSIDYSNKDDSLQRHKPYRWDDKLWSWILQEVIILCGPNKKGTDCGEKDVCDSNKKCTECGKRNVSKSNEKVTNSGKKDLTQTIFPPEITIEIQGWLPEKVLVKLDIESKVWYSRFEDRLFIERHMLRGSQFASIPSTHDTFEWIGACDGLLLRKCYVTLKYHIQNPTTGLFLELPAPRNTKLPLTFNFVPSTREFKLVSTYDDGEFCEVLTVGKDNMWRPLKIPTDMFQNWCQTCKKRENVTVVSTDSAVHWYQIYKVGSDFSREVVSLDLENECFEVTQFPEYWAPNWERICALNWNGRLGFARIVKEKLRVLVLEDYKTHLWFKKRKVVPLPFINQYGYLEDNLVPLGSVADTVWFWLKDKKVFSYNMETGRINDILESGYVFYECAPNLVCFNGMKTEEEFLNDLEDF